jgi:two-component system chemotaxis response regulator CheY
MREQAGLRNMRVLVVGGRPSGVQVLRAVLALAGVGSVSAEPDSARAIELLRHEAFNAVFCDDRCEPVSGVAFPLAARRTPGILNPMVPIFLLCSAARRRQVEQARDTGVTDVLARPVSAAIIIRKLHLAVARPRPFIAAADFFGPDRRGAKYMSFAGQERRKRAARKVKVALAAKTEVDPAPV